MGTGKTTLARALGEAMQLPVIHSDAVRKSLAGLTPTTPTPMAFGQGIYDEEFSRKTYAEMLRKAGERLAAGESVILDGSYKRAGERDLVRQLAREHGAKAIFIYCTCALEVVKERLGLRAHDPESISNGREEILEAQTADFDPLEAADEPALAVDTNRELKLIVEEVKNFISQQTPREM
jgi:hypothetical protein